MTTDVMRPPESLLRGGASKGSSMLPPNLSDQQRPEISRLLCWSFPRLLPNTCESRPCPPSAPGDLHVCVTETHMLPV